MNIALDHIQPSDRAAPHASSCGSVASLLLIAAGSVALNAAQHHEMVVKSILTIDSGKR